jgi:hypothetical protein
MKLRFFLFGLLSFAGCMVHAQNVMINPVVADVHFGLIGSMKYLHDATHGTGPVIGGGVRYNLQNEKLPLEFGANLDLGSVLNSNGDRNLKDIYYTNLLLALSLYSDYNFRRGTKLNPFVGLGACVGILDNGYADQGTTSGDINQNGSFYICPRIGVDLSYHLRISSIIYVSHHSFNDKFTVTIGYVFGDGYK